jgi:transcriptional regulator with XRE-family HTH domain
MMSVLNSSLHQQIISARRKKGLTQEQLAELSNVTVRTIQRIESGESQPRAYTLKVLASVLEISLEDLTKDGCAKVEQETKQSEPAVEGTADAEFLQLLNLSCFSYLLVPYVHFLLPLYLIRKRKSQSKLLNHAARSIISSQIYWIVALNLSMLVALAYNLFRAANHAKAYPGSYVLIFFAFYTLNAIIISFNFFRLKNFSG